MQANAGVRFMAVLPRQRFFCGRLPRLRPRTAPSGVLRDGVDQREPALLHLGERAQQRRLHVLRIVDRPFAVAAHGSCERGEIRLGPEQSMPMCALASSVPRSFAMRIWCAQSL